MASKFSRILINSAIARRLVTGLQQHRSKATTPFSLGVALVPQQEAWLVERCGKFHKVLAPGLNFYIPLVDSVKYVCSLKEQAIDIADQAALSSDNVELSIHGVLHFRVLEPYDASYAVENLELALTAFARVAIRNELSKISTEEVSRELESLSRNVLKSINEYGKSYGILCLFFGIVDIKLPDSIKEALQQRYEAEQRKHGEIEKREMKKKKSFTTEELLKFAKDNFITISHLIASFF